MSNIPTAEEFLKQRNLYQADIEEMIEFTKLHIEAALNAASNNFREGVFGGNHNRINKAIKDSYPLENIK